MHVLILGGTTEANALAAMMRGQHATLSLAGRTRAPVLPDIPFRIGGFGGEGGLAAWLRQHGVTALVDATHPFARQMPFHAAAAAKAAGVPLLSLLRPAWVPAAGDHWYEMADHARIITVLGNVPRNVFLTVGRMELEPYAAAPQHRYVVRSVDPVEEKILPNAVWIAARGPFSVENEAALMAQHDIDVLVTKNSGGTATAAKLEAARARGIPVALLARPPKPETERVETPAAAYAWIQRVHGASS